MFIIVTIVIIIVIIIITIIFISIIILIVIFFHHHCHHYYYEHHYCYNHHYYQYHYSYILLLLLIIIIIIIITIIIILILWPPPTLSLSSSSSSSSAINTININPSFLLLSLSASCCSRNLKLRTVAHISLRTPLDLINISKKLGGGLVYCFFFLSYLSRSLVNRWGTTVDFTTSFLHSSRFSAFCSTSMIFHSRPVHSLM